ncbi:MAG TPA: DnaJ domain-containing protein [Candidatus Limnocylindrales bacterium]|jgi:DnaJ-domain-containing protein 1|nr:DnaJ domain-containing protein [Candidatus Limnocylindrales bacterium]
MTDYFALLNEPRRPWLDAEALKKEFLTLSAQMHPDRVHNAEIAERNQAQERYAELNAAYQCLREPKERLRHLLELERGGKLEPIQNIPPALMDISLEIGQACRQTDEFLNRKRQAASPLLQVSFFEAGQEQTERLRALLQRLDSQREPLIQEIKELDAHWQHSEGTSDRSAKLTRMETLYHLISYYERWSTQMRERIVQLSI